MTKEYEGIPIRKLKPDWPYYRGGIRVKGESLAGAKEIEQSFKEVERDYKIKKGKIKDKPKGHSLKEITSLQINEPKGSK